MAIESGEHQVVVQKWEETERGWGTRPDGFSLHLSLDGLSKYIAAYWAKQPDAVPDEYSRPDGTPYTTGVSEAVVESITQAGDGIRFYDRDYPGDGGTDGWLRK